MEGWGGGRGEEGRGRGQDVITLNTIDQREGENSSMVFMCPYDADDAEENLLSIASPLLFVRRFRI